jgi:beta-N-acetylhexosaminidase
VSIDPYICTYDYTEGALRALVRVLCGEVQAKGKLPQLVVETKAQVSKQQWLVEKFVPARDSMSLTNLLNTIKSGSDATPLGLDHVSAEGLFFQHHKIESHQFVVRNSSTKELFGYCAAYSVEGTATGYLGLLLVDSRRRKQSIGDSLHARAIQALEQVPGITSIQLGFTLPMTLPGSPRSGGSHEQVAEWLGRRGWDFDTSTKQLRIFQHVSSDWRPPEGLSRALALSDVKYEFVQGGQEHALGVLEHVNLIASATSQLLYNLVLTEGTSSGIIRAKNLHDGSIIGMWHPSCLLLLLLSRPLHRDVPLAAAYRVTPTPPGAISGARIQLTSE